MKKSKNVIFRDVPNFQIGHKRSVANIACPELAKIGFITSQALGAPNVHSADPFTCLSLLWSHSLRARPPEIVHAFPGRDFRIFENLEKSESFDFRQTRSKTRRFHVQFRRFCRKSKFSDVSRFSKIRKS